MEVDDLFHLGGNFFEEIIQAIYTDRLRAGDVVIDAGASHGLHTFPIAELVGRTGQVIAYEPIRRLAWRLWRKTLRMRQVKVVNAALSDRSGKAGFNLVQAASGYSGLADRQLPQGLAETIEKIKVRTTTLDATAKRWPVRFIKMDIEGGEYHALLGGRAMLQSSRPLIVFEHAGQPTATAYGYSPNQFFELFDSLGYVLFDVFGRRYGSADWSRPKSPWYKVAAAIGTDDEVFCRERLPRLIFDVASRRKAEEGGCP